MSTLQIVARSPFVTQDINLALMCLGKEDALLLVGDGVYALASAEHLQQIKQVKVYALQEDVYARNITPSLDLELIDYPRFVALSLEFSRVSTWA